MRMVPSPSATRRITRTSVPGSTCLIEYAIEEIYGLHDQRSSSSGFIVAGIAPPKVVFGLGQRADIELAVLARFVRKILNAGKRHEQRFIFSAARGQNCCDVAPLHILRIPSRRDADNHLVAGFNIPARR